MEGKLHLEVDDSVSPVVMPLRRVQVVLKGKFKEETDRLIDVGVLNIRTAPDNNGKTSHEELDMIKGISIRENSFRIGAMSPTFLKTTVELCGISSEGTSQAISRT